LKGARISNPIPASDPLAAAQALYENRLRYTQFDAYGNVTEHTLDDGLFTSYVWGEKGSVILAKADHATVRQIYHTSFEEDANATLNNAKTGSRSFIVVGNYTVPSAALPTVPGNYILSYWTWTSAGNFWEYKEKRINNYQPGTAIVSDPISSGYIDEVRLFPAGAVMTTYTHEPLVGVTSITDANNVTTYYEYDSFNRLKCKRDQDRNILETYDYTFQQSVPFAVGNN
jgi:YD repeat-containing protein